MILIGLILLSQPIYGFFQTKKLPCGSIHTSLLMGLDHIGCLNHGCDLYHGKDYAKSSLMKIMVTLYGARKQIDLCMYRFTLSQIAKIFIQSIPRGVKIRIITDKAGPNERIENDQIPRLRHYGIRVREKDNRPGAREDSVRSLMHNKFVIIDEDHCILGSFNWTYAGVMHHDESVISCHEPRVVRKLVSKFNDLWDKLG
uniref:Mitochondrial cardiolipin hydrolase n=1 Tax=Aceria tosichella TaxID=561515 RepID=A0A6G1S7W3_9ACAR